MRFEQCTKRGEKLAKQGKIILDQGNSLRIDPNIGACWAGSRVQCFWNMVRSESKDIRREIQAIGGQILKGFCSLYKDFGFNSWLR